MPLLVIQGPEKYNASSRLCGVRHLWVVCYARAPLFQPFGIIMVSPLKTQPNSLGFLRKGLLGLAIVTMLLPIVEWLAIQLLGELNEDSILALSAGLIAPVMAPMLIVVILLDVIMSKVKAADDPAGSGDLYRMISRVDTTMIIIMLIFWVPFFISLTS